MLNFELVSPERLLMSLEVESVVVPGVEGDFMVLPNHSPVMSTIRPGIVTVAIGEGETKEMFVYGGFAEVTPTGLVILAEEALSVADLDKAQLAQKIQNAKEDIEDAKTDEELFVASEALAHFEAMHAAAS
jgi:F-type H+-transporting ATPase subunit epsilon